MSQSCTAQNLDDQKAFEDIVELVSHVHSETVLAMHSCASSLVREELEVAIKHLIKQGHTSLLAQFPELRQ